LRIDDETVLIFLGELSGSGDDLIDLRLGPEAGARAKMLRGLQGEKRPPATLWRALN
jgi:hypothetical protein